MSLLDELSIAKSPCPTCGGSGEYAAERDIGLALRKRREARGMSLRDMATNLGISAPYLSDLELGRRHWKQRYTEAYR